MFEALALSVGLVGLLYLPDLRYGLDLGDEGYLWFGSLEVLDGRIPIRDFRAYDPGRYAWSALWMRLLGRNLISIRIGLFVAQTLGLSAFVVALELATGDWLATALGALLLALWMCPRHKQVDAAIPAVALAITVGMVGAPRPELFAAGGAFAGVCFFFGLNHGLYVVGANTVLMAGLAWHGDGAPIASAALWWVLGLALGLAPMAGFLAIPGVLRSYWERKVVRVLRRGSTNLPLAIPWLWRRAPNQLGDLPPWGRRFVATVFTLMPLVFGLGLLVPMLAADLRGGSGALFGAASLGLFYMHHALSRANRFHLSLAAAPLLLCLAVVANHSPLGWLLLLALVPPSLLAIYGLLTPHHVWRRGRVSPTAFSVGDDTLLIPASQAAYLSSLRDLVENHSAGGERVFMVPSLVALYPLFGRRPAAYDVFCVYPATESQQAAMTEELHEANVSLALVVDRRLDGRDDLRFRNTHPFVWQYLLDTLAPLRVTDGLPADHHVFVRKPGLADDRE